MDEELLSGCNVINCIRYGKCDTTGQRGRAHGGYYCLSYIHKSCLPRRLRILEADIGPYPTCLRGASQQSHNE